MSDPNNAPGEQPVPDTTPAADAGAQPATLDPNAATIMGFDQDQLREGLFPESSQPEPIFAPVPTVPAATPPDAGAQPAAEAAPDADATGATPTKPPQRLSVRSLPATEQQQLAAALGMVRNGEATTVYEALQILEGPAATVPPAGTEPLPAAAASPAAAPPAPAAVSDLKTQLADLRAQRDDAERNYEIEDKIRLTNEIDDLQLDILRAEQAAAVTQAQQSSYQDLYLESVDAMEAKYEWATDENDPRFQALDDMVTLAQARNLPELADPNYILTFADRVEQQAAKVPGTVTKPTPPPAKPARLAGAGVAPGHQAAPVYTEDQIKAAINNASKEELALACFQ